jgi:hypothetical protein
MGEQIFEAVDGCGPEETLAKTLRKLQSIDRYEKRIASLKKRVFQKCNGRFSQRNGIWQNEPKFH